MKNNFMTSNSKFLPVLVTCSLCLLQAPVSFGQSVDWKGITIDVEATHRVAVEHQMVPDKNGFQRLEIILSNPGDALLTIKEIDISIPFRKTLSEDLEVIYGSSCMGRRPMLRETVEDDGKLSYSYMYEMIRSSEGEYLLAGSLSWRIFLPVLTVSESAVLVYSDGEGKQLLPGESISYEPIIIRQAPDWIELLNEFGKAIALENGIKAIKKTGFKGWATWDYYGRLFEVDDVIGNLDALNKLYPAANLIQIDGGWWTERGDYTSVRPDLQGGIKAMADQIKTDGKTAGLHFDGFRADLASEVYKSHPDYFLHDQHGNVIVEKKQLFDRVMNYIYFDYSHPGARAHIAACVQQMREWGITYFKVDFMRYGLESEIKQAHPSVTKVMAYDPSISGVERFRLGMQAIREAIGEENYFLGCSAVFGPCIGFVDGMRTGGDVHPKFEAFSERCLANSGNFYLDGTVFNGDADYLVFREAADEDERVSRDNHKSGGSLEMHEAAMWADYNKIYGNCRLQSDNLMSLRAERKELVREVFEWPAMDESVPLDIWNHAANKQDGFELILAQQGDDIFLGVFNWGDSPRTYDLAAFGKNPALILEGRHSTVLTYQGTDTFNQLRRKLQRK
ncbi:alpha-galactosidase [Puniceicoccales bacterium CK1056]|uniref:Alpha-galactosidase n=1 Tax=Oceanipulchritudo coccoides TaxID=2706888 RepID=A0A6B2LZT2_9BACT|nr:glycoside hydrolase family 36 protein [Oceanipulchritudo coccoides]NDV61015.1 alpha-galactosidase [Oceanipulchritudo coccoides]